MCDIKPNLILIPSNQGSKINSVLPSDGSGDFNFARDSKATRINKDGLIENVDENISRLNYSMIDGKVVGCPSLLLEPQSTNYITYSEDIESWATTGTITKTNNVHISPDGTQNAGTITSSASGFDRITQTISVSTNSTYTASLFIKKEQTQTNYMGIGFIFTGGTTDVGYVIFDAINGVAVSGDARIDVISEVKDFGDYWQLISTATDNGNNTSLQSNIYSTLSTNGTTTGSGISSPRTIWGIQLEEGSYPTSYIPTNGASATRLAETANGAGNADTFNDSEGVLMAEISALVSSDGSRDIEISDGNTNRIIIQYNSIGTIQVYVLVNGVATYTSEYTTLITQFNKIALKYKENDFALWVDGFEADSSNSGSVFSSNTLTQLDFLKGVDSSLNFYGNTKQIQYHNSVLTDSELEQLTSWDSFIDMAEAQLYSVY